MNYLQVRIVTEFRLKFNGIQARRAIYLSASITLNNGFCHGLGDEIVTQFIQVTAFIDIKRAGVVFKDHG
jgi:hypothetical protein